MATASRFANPHHPGATSPDTCRSNPTRGPTNPSTPPMDPERPFVPERASVRFNGRTEASCAPPPLRWPTFRTLTAVTSH